MKAKVTILGCGNSTGVPAIGNAWGACDPNEPRNRRTRSSVCVQSDKTTIIIDTGPDFRYQLNRENIPTLDAVLYTHAHGDHINGIDELRVITHRNKTLTPIYANSWTLKNLETKYIYIFHGTSNELYQTLIEPHEITNFGKPITIGDIDVVPFEQDHGTCTSAGYRFGDFGYSVDMLKLDDAGIQTLKGIKTWIVDGAGYKDPNSKVHANLETIYKLNEQIGAEQVYLSSLTLAMDYQTLRKELKKGYEPAYDGLAFEINI